ncbi:iron-hydroxamate ABC transporter substrate-binding protein [Halobacillus massiliensis]|uniref:iron-hydroxamate ABC transporter substrate-binding protein n=1 Tax=Halobacillus massiliensis TaxID=1926286 RepID=UPI0009E245EB|nr:iron-hydroxamate ABC transporter substrate-binding protein [Halobacillus massiliensis]
MKNKIWMFVSLFLMITLIACSNSEDSEDTSSDDNTEESSSEERTLEHASGEVTIPANPERVIAPYLEDSLTALGVTPAAQWSIGESVLDYLQPELEDVPTISWDLPLEQTLEADPGLIIFSSPSSLQNGSYEDYEQIAPTYVMDAETNADWREQLTQMGEILNKQEEAEQALTDFDDLTANMKESLQEAIGDESVAFIWTMGEEFYVFEPTRYGAEVLYEEVGLTQPEFIKNLEQEEQWNPMSLEKLSELDADHVFLIGEENEPGFEVLDNSSVWQNVPAVENDHVYVMNDPSHWTIDGVIAHEMTLKKVNEALTNE